MSVMARGAPCLSEGNLHFPSATLELGNLIFDSLADPFILTPLNIIQPHQNLCFNSAININNLLFKELSLQTIHGERLAWGPFWMCHSL